MTAGQFLCYLINKFEYIGYPYTNNLNDDRKSHIATVSNNGTILVVRRYTGNNDLNSIEHGNDKDKIKRILDLMLLYSDKLKT